MKSPFFFFLLIAGLSYTQCSTYTQGETYLYNQSKCADPWDPNVVDDNSATMEALEKYLEEQGIDVQAVSIAYRDSLYQYCESCACLSGNVIEIRGGR